MDDRPSMYGADFFMEQIQWRKIDGFKGAYEVSNTGLIRSSIIGDDNSKKILPPLDADGYRILRQTTRKTGYKVITLSNGGIAKFFHVGRLVATYWIPNPNNYPVVNHIDNNPSNNHYTNLEWCTYSHNTRHAFNTGRMTTRYGEQSPRFKITDAQIEEIKKLSLEGESSRAIAKKYNISKTQVLNYRKGARVRPSKYKNQNI